MALQASVAVRNARGDVVESTIGTGAILKIFTGAAPANCAAANSGTELFSASLGTDWLDAAASGVKALAAPVTAAAIATGTAAHFRIYASDGTTCHLQGTVTATGGGGDMTVDNTSIASGQDVTVNSFGWTEPNA